MKIATTTKGMLDTIELAIMSITNCSCQMYLKLYKQINQQIFAACDIK